MGREARPEVREESGGTPGQPKGVEGPTLRSGRGLEVCTEVWEGSGVPP